MFHSLKSLIPGTLTKYKIAPAIEATRICTAAQECIRDILGQSATSPRALYVKDDVLAIGVVSAADMAELKLYESAILETLHDQFPQVTMKGVRFLVIDQSQIH